MIERRAANPMALADGPLRHLRRAELDENHHLRSSDRLRVAHMRGAKEKDDQVRISSIQPVAAELKRVLVGAIIL